MRKEFKGKTIYIKDGVELEIVRDILVANGESWRMGYDDTYDEEKSVSRGYLYRTGNKWYISLTRNEKLELITLEEFKAL